MSAIANLAVEILNTNSNDLTSPALKSNFSECHRPKVVPPPISDETLPEVEIMRVSSIVTDPLGNLNVRAVRKIYGISLMAIAMPSNS